uniref:Uncharacterized protein n=1 Tax=Zea mays TaxID=4577 RepID=A0A804N7R7_MAIZE
MTPVRIHFLDRSSANSIIACNAPVVVHQAPSIMSSVSPSGSKGDGVNPLHVRVEEAPVLLHSGVLLVLVEHGEHVCLHPPGPPRRALPHVPHQVLVVRPGVLQRRCGAARRRPPGLRHHHPDAVPAGDAEPPHRRVQRVHRGVEQVLVPVLPVLHHRPGRREQREVHAQVAQPQRVDEVGVQVGQQRRAGPRQERHHVAHERAGLLRELARRRRQVHGDGALRDGRGDLHVAQPGGRQRRVHVLHGRHEQRRLLQGDLVAHHHVAERHRRVRLHVVADPRRGRGRAGRQRRQGLVGRAHHHPDPAPAQRRQRVAVGPVEPHHREAVVAQHAHHRARRRQVVAARAVAHAHRRRPCVGFGRPSPWMERPSERSTYRQKPCIGYTVSSNQRLGFCVLLNYAWKDR